MNSHTFLFTGNLASAKAIVDTLVPIVVPDLIEDTRWNLRAASNQYLQVWDFL
jgi:hypothetical protein